MHADNAYSATVHQPPATVMNGLFDVSGSARQRPPYCIYGCNKHLMCLPVSASMYTYGPLLITCYCASLWCMYWPLVYLQRKILLFIQVSEIAYSVAQKHYKIFDFIQWIWAVQPLEQRMLTAFSQCSLISMCKHACMLPVYTFWAHCTSLTLFRQCFCVIPPLRVYMNLCSMFPSLNVVTAGLNRMQVSCYY